MGKSGDKSPGGDKADQDRSRKSAASTVGRFLDDDRTKRGFLKTLLGIEIAKGSAAAGVAASAGTAGTLAPAAVATSAAGVAAGAGLAASGVADIAGAWKDSVVFSKAAKTAGDGDKARQANRMSDKALDQAARNNGFKDVHDMKDELGLDRTADIFSDRNGNMYSGPTRAAKGQFDLEPLGIKVGGN